jgi:head-tail adaptor
MGRERQAGSAVVTIYHLKHRLVFSARQLTSDGFGNEQGDFADEFTRWADVRPSLGIETVNAARLDGVQPVDITVLRDDDTERIAADWRVTDIYEGNRIYALTAPPIDLADDGLYLTFKAKSGAGVAA